MAARRSSRSWARALFTASPRSTRRWSTSSMSSRSNVSAVARTITPSGMLLNATGTTRISRAATPTRTESTTSSWAPTRRRSIWPRRITRRTWSLAARSSGARMPWLASGTSSSSLTTSITPASDAVWRSRPSSAAEPSPSSSNSRDRTPLKSCIAVSTEWLLASVRIRLLNAAAVAPASSSESTASAQRSGSQPLQSWVYTAEASCDSTLVIAVARARKRRPTTSRARAKFTAPTARPADRVAA